MRFIVENSSLPPPDQNTDNGISKLLEQAGAFICFTNAPDDILQRINEEKASEQDLIFIFLGSSKEAIAPFESVAHEALVRSDFVIKFVLTWWRDLKSPA